MYYINTQPINNLCNLQNILLCKFIPFEKFKFTKKYDLHNEQLLVIEIHTFVICKFKNYSSSWILLNYIICKLNWLLVSDIYQFNEFGYFNIVCTKFKFFSLLYWNVINSNGLKCIEIKICMRNLLTIGISYLLHVLPVN